MECKKITIKSTNMNKINVNHYKKIKEIKKLKQKNIYDNKTQKLNNNYVLDNNTINFAIKIFLRDLQQSNINYINDLIDYGILIDNEKENTLSLILNLGAKYILNAFNSKKAVKNLLKLLQFLINRGAKPDNLDILCFNTLTFAVRTNNLDIVKFVHQQVQAQPDISNSEKNTLTQAVLLANFDIIKYIIIAGAKPDNSISSTFDRFYKLCYHVDEFCHYDTLNKIFNLLMCSGAQISKTMYDTLCRRYKCTKFEKKIIHCYKILDRSNSSENQENHDIHDIHDNPDNPTSRKIKKELNDTMNELISVVTNDRYNEIKSVTHIYACLTKIIYEYQYSEPFNIVDWTKI